MKTEKPLQGKSKRVTTWPFASEPSTEIVAPEPPPPLNDDGLHRRPIPLHQGFGFGATQIRERAMSVAREATQRKETRIRQLLEQPIASASELPSPAEFKAAAEETIVTVPQRPLNPRTVPAQAPRSARPPQSALPRTIPASERVAPQKVSPLHTGWAWVLDSIVGILSLAGALLGNHLLPFIPSMAPAKAAAWLSKTAGMGSLVLWQAAIDLAVRGAILLFIVQYCSLMLSGVSLGRYAAGIAPRGRPNLVSAICAAMSEVASLAGTLSLPLALLMPNRHPVCWWLRMARPSSGNR